MKRLALFLTVSLAELSVLSGCAGAGSRPATSADTPSTASATSSKISGQSGDEANVETSHRYVFGGGKVAALTVVRAEPDAAPAPVGTDGK